MFNPRIVQIFSLLSLLGLGVSLRDFSIYYEQVFLTFSAGLLAQAFFLKLYKIKTANRYLSAFITCFGIALLLRSSTLWVHPLASIFAISSKFIFRFNDKHIFNPANIGVIFALSFLPSAWVSSGQWGSDIAFAFLFLALGLSVVFRARMATSSLCFFASYFLIWFLYRNIYLGYELSALTHQLGNGALLLFAFFMISDPKTSPNSEGAKIIHAFFVAILAHIFNYYYYYNNGVLFALLASSPVVVLLDTFFKAKKYCWSEELSCGNLEKTNEIKTIPISVNSSISFR